MPYDEFLGWSDYFERRPVGWREDDRVFKILQTQGVKASPNEVFQSLGPIYNPKSNVKLEDGQFNVSNLKSSLMFKKMLSAKGGDVINYD